MLGLIAGMQLWPEFLSESSGLRLDTLLRRLTRSVIERTSLLSRAILTEALEAHRWGVHWHNLHYALTATGPYPDALWDNISAVASAWLDQDEDAASAAMGGIVLPFLWYQRHLL
jgi:hypothetical protein